MSAPRPHVTTKIDSADKRTKVGNIFGSVELENRINFLFPGFHASRCEPVAEPISFLDGPLALERVNSEAVLLKASQNFANFCHVSFKVVVENADVVNKNFNLLEHVFENVFHNFLCEVGAVANSHGELKAAIFAEGSNNDTEPGGLLVEFEGTKLHGDVDLGETLVIFAPMENVLDSGQSALFADEHGVENAEVGDPADTVVLLGNNKGWVSVLGGAARRQNAFSAKVISFVSEKLLMFKRNRKRARMMKLRVGLEV